MFGSIAMVAVGADFYWYIFFYFERSLRKKSFIRTFVDQVSCIFYTSSCYRDHNIWNWPLCGKYFHMSESSINTNCSFFIVHYCFLGCVLKNLNISISSLIMIFPGIFPSVHLSLGYHATSG